MKISKLIQHLEDILMMEGNIEVFIPNADSEIDELISEDNLHVESFNDIIDVDDICGIDCESEDEDIVLLVR